MNQLLSICIPTYSRPALLRQTLSILINQVNTYEIQIIISDNSEDTLTENVVKELSSIYSHLLYFKNDKNIGIDRNFLNVAQHAQTTWIWFFGDDDLPLPGAVDRVLSEIKNAGDINFFLANSKSMSADLQNELNENLTGFKEDKVYRDHNQALREVSWYSTFIGAYIVRKETWTSVEPSKYLDTAFVHVGIMFEAMPIENFALKIISNPLIGYRTGNASWSGSFLQIQLTLWRQAIFSLPNKYDLESKTIAVESVVERFVTPGTLAGTRIAGHLNWRSFRKYIFPYLMWARKKRPSTWMIFLVSIILLFTPSSALNILRDIYRRIRYGE